MSDARNKPTSVDRTETQVDLELEGYFRKLLLGQAQQSDQADYERLQAWRRANLVDLTPVKRSIRNRDWFQKAG